MPPDPNASPAFPALPAFPTLPAATPATPFTPAPPSAPGGYGTFPPPAPQPFYGTLPPSQPLYAAAPAQQQLYAAPATVPFAPPLQGAPVSQVLLGPNAMPGAAQPYSRIQALLMRNLSPGAVVTPWITAIIGAVAALAAGLILTALAGALWSNALGELLKGAATNTTGSAGSTLGAFASVAQQTLSPDLLKLFALAHHVTLNISGSASSQLGSTTGSATSQTLALSIPLTGLLLVPALALALGGYISAASDFSRQARYSIARGALVAPFYAVLLAGCAMFGSSTHTISADSTSALSTFGTITIAPSVGEAILYGLLWGALFGALGGWMHVSGRYWLSTALATLQTVRNGRVAGALAGATSALVTGILLFSVAYVGVAAFSGVSGVAFSSGSGSGTSVVTTLMLNLLFAPVVGVYGFALATGAPIGFFVTDSSNQLNSSATVSLLNGYQVTAAPASSGLPTTSPAALPHFPPSPLYYLLILGALLSYLVGGRIAARVARAEGAGGGFVAGALMAVPLSLLMTLAAYLATAGLTLNFSQGTQNETFGITVSPVYGGVFLAVLIAGAVCGGIGGASVNVMPWLGAVPRALTLPFRPFGKLLSPLLDLLSGRDRRQPPSLATRWIRDGVGAAVVFAVLAVALDILNTTSPKLLPFAVLWRVGGIVAALLVAVPLACFLGALVAAFLSPPPLIPAAVAPPAMSMPNYATMPSGMPGAFTPSIPMQQYPSMPQQAPVTAPQPDYGYGASGPTTPSQPSF